MNDVTINGAQFKDMVCVAAALLEKNRAKIDALNVFPVPDGDTGTNMCMTMESAVRELQKLKEAPTVSDVADAISMGALRGARGNSGVILSQLFRGFSKAFKGLSQMDSDAFALAVSKGSESAYKAVMRPKEGTILSVARAVSESVAEQASRGANVYRLIDTAVEAAEIALAKTPDQLPVLKEAGVVDSGGKGLTTIYHGFKLYLDGGDVAEFIEREESNTKTSAKDDKAEEITYSYSMCFDVIRMAPGQNETEIESFRTHLIKLGQDVSVTRSDDSLKVTVCTDAPGKVLQMALRFGELDHIEVDNLQQKRRAEQEERRRNEKEYAVIAVSSGSGINEAFTSLGASHIITGGQTMNPSIDSIAEAVYEVNARNVFILPNNSNIIMAAQQAAKLSECNVIVLQTKTIPQGFSAMLAFDPTADVESNTSLMQSAVKHVVSGAVTYAVRNTQFNGITIHKGDILGMIDNELYNAKSEVCEVVSELITEMIRKGEEDVSSVTLFYGEEISTEQAESMAREISESYPDIDCIVQSGGQSLYYYYISVE